MLVYCLPSKTNNVAHLLESRKQGGRINIDHFRHARAMSNLAKNDFTETAYKQDREIMAFSIQDELITVLTLNALSLIDNATKTCLWTYHLKSPVHRHRAKIITTKDLTILSSAIESNVSPHIENGILVIDRHHGKKIGAIQDSRLDTEKICCIGNRIFTLFNDGNIHEWDIIRRKFIPLAIQNFHAKKFISSDSFLIGINDDSVIIHDIIKNTSNTITFNFNKKKEHISAFNLNKSHLTLGISSYAQKNDSDCIVIDLHKKSIIYQYQASGAFVYPEGDLYTDENPYLSGIKQIVKHKNYIYMWHSRGAIICVNMNANTHFHVGEHHYTSNPRNDSNFLVRNHILISKSIHEIYKTTLINFWNTSDGKTITKVEPSKLTHVFCDVENLFAVEENILKIRNYLSCG